MHKLAVPHSHEAGGKLCPACSTRAGLGLVATGASSSIQVVSHRKLLWEVNCTDYIPSCPWCAGAMLLPGEVARPWERALGSAESHPCTRALPPRYFIAFTAAHLQAPFATRPEHGPMPSSLLSRSRGSSKTLRAARGEGSSPQAVS